MSGSCNTLRCKSKQILDTGLCLPAIGFAFPVPTRKGAGQARRAGILEKTKECLFLIYPASSIRHPVSLRLNGCDMRIIDSSLCPSRAGTGRGSRG
jgi:hypothetical protein